MGWEVGWVGWVGGGRWTSLGGFYVDSGVHPPRPPAKHQDERWRKKRAALQIAFLKNVSIFFFNIYLR